MSLRTSILLAFFKEGSLTLQSLFEIAVKKGETSYLWTVLGRLERDNMIECRSDAYRLTSAGQYYVNNRF